MRTNCDGCSKWFDEVVEIDGVPFCQPCSEIYGATCKACGVLCERNEMVEIGRWVQLEHNRKWEVSYVEPLCLLSFTLALRAERVLDLDRALGREAVQRAVEMAREGNALVVYDRELAVLLGDVLVEDGD